MADLRLPPARPHHPATFRERGVAVPFTTPLLAGSRARVAEKGPPELVIPNLSGGAGVYVMGWPSIAALFPPTLHDRELYDRIAILQHLTPRSVRRVSREVAAEGLAGEDALEAANRATKEEKGDRLVANYSLLLGLIGQVDAGVRGSDFSTDMSATEVERRARLAVSAIAPKLGRSNEWVAAALEGITDVLAGVGINLSSMKSRRSRVVERLRGCCNEIGRWSAEQQSEDHVSYAEMICAVGEFTLRLANAILAQTRALTADIVGLLRMWAVDPQPVVRLAIRLEWLLDGWDQICVIWRMAKDDAERRAAVVEMGLTVPLLPREVRDWSDLCRDVDIPSRLRRLIPMKEDWRAGTAAFDLIARNEQIRAAIC